MLEAPEFAGSAEACLNFVEGEDDVVFVAPLTELLNVLFGGECSGAALVCFEHDACDVFRLHVVFFECFEEDVEGSVFLAEAIGEWDLNHGRVEVDDPRFESGMPPAICEPRVRPWKALPKVTIPILRLPPTETPCVRMSLIAHSVDSEPVVRRKTLLSP